MKIVVMIIKYIAFRVFVPFLQFKNVKNAHGGLLLLVKLQAKACNFSKINTTP